MSEREKAFMLKQELNAWLEMYPEYKEKQREIDARLKKAGSQHNRCVVIQGMMMESLEELKTKLEELLAEIHKLPTGEEK